MPDNHAVDLLKKRLDELKRDENAAATWVERTQEELKRAYSSLSEYRQHRIEIEAALGRLDHDPESDGTAPSGFAELPKADSPVGHASW